MIESNVIFISNEELVNLFKEVADGLYKNANFNALQSGVRYSLSSLRKHVKEFISDYIGSKYGTISFFIINTRDIFGMEHYFTVNKEQIVAILYKKIISERGLIESLIGDAI